MRKVFLRAFVSIFVALVLVMSCCVSVFALDDKYTIKELGMSIKIPKEYMVITRELERDDEVFSALNLDYDETMTAFSAADIYLQALSDDSMLKITLTETSDENSQTINNYSDLSEAERKQVLDALIESGNCTSGIEIKHNGNIYFDLSLTRQSGESTIYCYQSHTVVNGMNINLTLHKENEKLTADEIKVITDIANTVNFDKVTRKSGMSFEWWRLLLWIAILVAIALLSKYFYSKYNQHRNQNRRKKRKIPVSEEFSEKELLLHTQPQYTKESGNLHTLLSELGLDKDEELGFDELLGYDTTNYHERANTELDNFDIKVRSKDKRKGVSYFDDSGNSINRTRDYFDEFFEEETEHRPFYKRFFSSVSLYFQMMARRAKKNLNHSSKQNKKSGNKRRK